jgi:transcriptional regulator with XRE-family HTH domain
MRRVASSLGHAIARERVLSGFSQDAFAAACGISRRHLAAIEGGANLTVSVLMDIARNLPPTSALPLDDFLLLRVPHAG